MRKLRLYLISTLLLTAFLALGHPVVAQDATTPATTPTLAMPGAAKANLSPETIQQISEGLPPGVLQQLQKIKPDTPPAPETAQSPAGQGEKDTPAAHLQKTPAAKLAVIEQLFRNNYGSDLARDLSQFGYTLFSSGSITPSSLAVPDGNYILGPGDTLQIRIWGASIDADYTGAISREGYLNIPRVGIVAMAGVKFGQAEKIIRKEAEKYVQGINLSVSLARLHSVEVFVVGDVPNPGLQLVPAFSTVLEGLLSSGGVNKSGSLRTLQLFRDNKLYRTIDLYELLLTGSRAADVLLQDRDVIFVPPIGRTAAVAGALAKNAIFELKAEKSLADLLTLGGGLLPQAFSGRIYLRRFENNNQFAIRDLTEALVGDRLKEMDLRDGDLLEVNFLGSQRPEVVKLTGNVWHEDVFTSRPGLKISEIMTGPELLKPEAITDFALLYRYNADTTRYEAQKIPLQGIFAKKFDLELKPFDQIQILSRQDYESDKPLKLEIDGQVWRPEFVKLTGHVWFSDIFSYRTGLKLSDILTGPDLLRPEAIIDFALLYRYNPETTRYEARKIPLQQTFSKEADLELKPFDRIQILSRQDYESDKPFKVEIGGRVWRPEFVKLTGQVWFPDIFSYRAGLKLSDILVGPQILRPGAITDFALLHHYSDDDAGYTTAKIPLSEIFSHTFDAELRPFDRIEILAKATYGINEPIRIGGAVWKPGDYEFTPNLTLKDLVAQAGGSRFGADPASIDISRQVIDHDKATTIHFVSSFTDNPTLQPYDYVLIREIKGASTFKNVTLGGEFRYPGTYRIHDGEKLSDLIDRAGGFTERAYFYGAIFSSAQAKIVQQKSLEKLLDDLAVRIETSLADQARQVEKSGETAGIQAQQTYLRGLVERLRKVGATGRMSVSLAAPSALKGSSFDFTLEDGDTLQVPTRPNFISVVGSVYTPNSFLFQDDFTLGDYLGKAGGPTESAAPKYIYVLKANGEVLSRYNDHLLFRSFEQSRLMPGDTIVVPEDVDKIPYLALVSNISDIFFKVATTAGVVAALLK